MGVKVREKPIGSGIFWIFVDHQGKRKSKKIGHDRRLAEEAAKKIEAKLVLGDMGIEKPGNNCPTFGEHSEKWLAFIATKRRQSTYERYSQVLRAHVWPTLRKRPLDKITRGEIRDLLIKKSENFHVGVIKDCISGVMGFAVDDEIIKANPVTGITKKLGLLKKNNKADVDPFNEAELSLFLDKAREIAPDLYPLFLMGARTGMRLGELLAVRWGDIQFKNPVVLGGEKVENRPFVWVKRTYRRGVFTAPKNGKTRKVDMSVQLEVVLRDHLVRAKKEALRAGSGEVVNGL